MSSPTDLQMVGAGRFPARDILEGINRAAEANRCSIDDLEIEVINLAWLRIQTKGVGFVIEEIK